MLAQDVSRADLATLRQLIVGRPKTAVILRFRRPNTLEYQTVVIRGASSRAASALDAPVASVHGLHDQVRRGTPDRYALVLLTHTRAGLAP